MATPGISCDERRRLEQSAGYAIYDSLLPAAHATEVLEVLSSSVVARSKAGARHVLAVPAVMALSHDARLLTIARAFVGAHAVPFRATLFEKSADANWLVAWHQDTALPLRTRVHDPEWGPWSTKDGVLYAHAPAWALGQIIALRVSLDASTAGNGPLRVLPRSHRFGVLDDDEIARRVRETTAIDCLTAAGGVVAMRPLIVHASSKSLTDARRRVLHIEYAASLTLTDGVELAIG